MKRKLAIIAIVTCFGCSRESKTIDSLPSVSHSNAYYVPPDVAAFVKKYPGLAVDWTKTNSKFWKSFNDTASAGTWLRAEKIRKTTLPQIGLPPPTGVANFQAPNCGEGHYQAYTNTAGLFTEFIITFDLDDAGNMSNIHVSLIGFPFLWSWQTSSASWVGGNNSGCAWGTVIWGINLRGIPTSYHEPMQFRLRKSGCSLDVVSGQTACYY